MTAAVRERIARPTRCPLPCVTLRLPLLWSSSRRKKPSKLDNLILTWTGMLQQQPEPEHLY